MPNVTQLVRLFLISDGIFIQWNTMQINEVGLLVVHEKPRGITVCCFMLLFCVKRN